MNDEGVQSEVHSSLSTNYIPKSTVYGPDKMMSAIDEAPRGESKHQYHIYNSSRLFKP